MPKEFYRYEGVMPMTIATKKYLGTEAQLVSLSLRKFQEQIEKAFWLDPLKRETLIACILTGGHILIEDRPGTGKTSLAKFIASLLGLSFSRIQFTSDLLPSDISGMMVLDPKNREYSFREGPLFANLVLADELNRASGKTQSALLEAMAEGKVTIDRRTFFLPEPFIVIATENDAQSIGTYPIPESQLDRFAIKIDLGYPPQAKEIEIMQLKNDFSEVSVSPVLQASEILEIRAQIRDTFVASETAAYISNILHASRTDKRIHQGVSTRAGISWVSTAKGLAYLRQRTFVIPEDLLDCAPFVLPHRILVERGSAPAAIADLLQSIAIP
jgi:MoxR-like ATPase